MSAGLIFHQLFDSESSTFTYLLADTATKEAALIDPVFEKTERDLKLIDELGLKLLFVLDTHVHADHITAAAKLRKLRGAKAAVPKKAGIPCADVNLSEGDELKLGSISIRVIETPGHTDASLCFLCQDMLFSGDTLLVRGTGRTDFQSGSASDLYDSITKKLFTLPKQTRIYPGHDYNGFTSSSIQEEIMHNPRVGGGKTKDEFIKIMSELKLDIPKKLSLVVTANQVCGTISND